MDDSCLAHICSEFGPTALKNHLTYLNGKGDPSHGTCYQFLQWLLMQDKGCFRCASASSLSGKERAVLAALKYLY